MSFLHKTDHICLVGTRSLYFNSFLFLLCFSSLFSYVCFITTATNTNTLEELAKNRLTTLILQLLHDIDFVSYLMEMFSTLHARVL